MQPLQIIYISSSSSNFYYYFLIYILLKNWIFYNTRKNQTDSKLFPNTQFYDELLESETKRKTKPKTTILRQLKCIQHFATKKCRFEKKRKIILIFVVAYSLATMQCWYIKWNNFFFVFLVSIKYFAFIFFFFWGDEIFGMWC